MAQLSVYRQWESTDLSVISSYEETREYVFRYVTACNMCGSSSHEHKVLGKRLNRAQGRSPRSRIGVATTVVQCNACRLIFANPLPIPRSIDDHYGVEPDDYWHRDYFLTDDSYFIKQIERFNSLFRGNAARTALDIGAGTGKCLFALKRAGFDAFGVEGSATFHRAAIERNGIAPDRIALASIEDARFEPGSFEFVTFGAVLEHLYDPSGAIKKALDWLAPEGLIHIEVPSARWLIAKLANLFYRFSGNDYVANLSPMHSPFHLYEFDLECFERHSRRFAYEIVHCEFYVAQTFMPRVISPLLARIMEKTNTGMQLEVWLRKGRC